MKPLSFVHVCPDMDTAYQLYIGSLAVFAFPDQKQISFRRRWGKHDRADLNSMHCFNPGITLSKTEWSDLFSCRNQINQEITAFLVQQTAPTFFKKIGDRTVHVAVGLFKSTATVYLQHFYSTKTNPEVLYPSVPSVTVSSNEWHQLFPKMQMINDLL